MTQFDEKRPDAAHVDPATQPSRSRVRPPPKPRGVAHSCGVPQPQSSRAKRPPINSPARAGSDAHEEGSQVVVGNDGAHKRNALHSCVSPVIAEIIQMWRLRQSWLRAKNRLVLAAKALCLSSLPDRTHPKPTKAELAKAKVLFDKTKAGKDVAPALATALVPFLSSIEHFEPGLKQWKKHLEKRARELPIRPWVADIKGFGALNLAALIGEAGDIGAYRNPSCLWKRMGLAVIDGERQRKHADKEMALIHGYNPSRRAVAWNIGECILKKPNRYRAVYDERKAKMMAREGMTKAHAHKDAMRFMTKRVLRDLWIAWRKL